MITSARYNFLRWRAYALVLSLAILVAGIVVIATRGLRLGVEFEGGTAVLVRFSDAPPLAEVRGVLTRAFGPDVMLHRYGQAGAGQIMVRIPPGAGDAGGATRDTGPRSRALSVTGSAVRSVEAALRQGGFGAFEIDGSEYVGPAVGDELRTQGLTAGGLALGGILTYLTIRYRFSFAIGAVVATLHDLLVAVSFLAFFDYDLTLNVVAALLTVAGYSSNDTVVVFDRVREQLIRRRPEPLDATMNLAINQTLGRTVITAGTTLLAVLALFVFGGDALRGFAFTLLVGVISGTYSTVFIAASVVTLGRFLGGGGRSGGLSLQWR